MGAGDHKLYLGHPQFEDFEVRQTVGMGKVRAVPKSQPTVGPCQNTFRSLEIVTALRASLASTRGWHRASAVPLQAQVLATEGRPRFVCRKN
jgi:hypothetical protein